MSYLKKNRQYYFDMIDDFKDPQIKLKQKKNKTFGECIWFSNTAFRIIMIGIPIYFILFFWSISILLLLKRNIWMHILFLILGASLIKSSILHTKLYIKDKETTLYDHLVRDKDN